MAIKKQSNVQQFPHDQFPFKVIHKDGKDLKDTKTCYFQSQAHVDKYIEKSKFKQKDYQLFIKPGTDVETVGKGTRRKSTQKRSRSRQSSSN
jgi:hypothetical protein